MNKKPTKKNIESSHMGQTIKRALKEQKMSVIDFANAIHCSRTNVYGLFERKIINLERLKQIINVLDLNITDFITETKEKRTKNLVIMEADNETLEQLLCKYDSTSIKHWQIN